MAAETMHIDNGEKAEVPVTEGRERESHKQKTNGETLHGLRTLEIRVYSGSDPVPLLGRSFNPSVADHTPQPVLFARL